MNAMVLCTISFLVEWYSTYIYCMTFPLRSYTASHTDYCISLTTVVEVLRTCTHDTHRTHMCLKFSPMHLIGRFVKMDDCESEHGTSFHFLTVVIFFLETIGTQLSVHYGKEIEE